MKRLNLKFLLFLLVPVLLAAVGAHFLREGNVKKTEGMWLESGLKAKEEGRPREALELLSKYLRVNREDLEREQIAALLAADVFFLPDGFNNRDFHRAKDRLQAAARRTTSDIEKRRELEQRLIDVLVRVGQFSVAHEYIRDHLAAGVDDPKLLFTAARCAAVLKHTGKAESPEYFLCRITGFLPDAESEPFFDTEAALDIGHIEAFGLLAAYYREIDGNPGLADEVIKGLVDLHGDSDDKEKAAQAHLVRGIYRLKHKAITGNEIVDKKERKLARADIEAALARKEDFEEALLTLADLDLAEQDIEAARANLKKALEYHPGSVQGYVRLLRLFGPSEEETAEALALIEEGLSHNPGNPELLWQKSMKQLAMRDGPGMRKTIDEMSKTATVRAPVEVAEALLPICDSDWNRAINLLLKVRPQAVENPALRRRVDQHLADSYLQTKEWDRRLEVLDEMRQDAAIGGSDELLTQRVHTLIQLQRMQDAKNELGPRFMRAATPEDVPEQLRALAQVVARWESKNRGARSGSGAGANPVDGESPLPPVSVDIAGNAEDWLDDDDYWEKLRGKSRQMLVAGKVDEALTFFKNGLDLQEQRINQLPDAEKDAAIEPWINGYYAYIQVVRRYKDRDAALAALDELREKRGYTQRLVIETVNVLATESGSATRQAIQKLESKIREFPDRQQAQAWVQFGMAYLRAGGASGLGAAKNCWTEAAKLAPKDKPTLQLLFDLARQAQDEAGMRVAIERIKDAVSERDTLWKYARAHYLVATSDRSPGNLEEAVKLVDQAIGERKNWAPLYQLRGHIRDLDGDLDGALLDYENARRRGARTIPLISRILEMRIARQEYAEAEAVIAAVGSTFPGIQHHVTILKVIRGDDAEATMEGIANIQQGESSWEAWIRRAEMYRRAARGHVGNKESVAEFYGKAESAYRDAVKVGHSIPQTWLALIDFLVHAKRDLASAERVLRAAEGRLSDDVARRVLAQGYIYIRDFPQAEHYLHAILDAEPNNLKVLQGLADYYLRSKQNDKGTQLLQRMIAQGVEEDSESRSRIMWAHRKLASQLASTGDHSDFMEALAELEINEELMSENLQDLSLRAQILANRNEPRYRRQAMRLLERVYRADPTLLNFESSLLLARLYQQDALTPSDERWRRYNQIMDGLLDSERARREKRTPAQRAQLLGQLSSVLLGRGSFSQAANNIRALKSLEPASPRSVRLMAKWHMAKKDPEAAAKEIERLVPNKITTRSAMQLLLAAKLFDEVGMNDRAEQAFRRLADSHPSGHVELAKYLAGRDFDPQDPEAVAANKEVLAIAAKIAESKSPQDVATACRIGLMAIQQLGDDASRSDHDLVAEWFKRGQKTDSSLQQILQLKLLEGDFAIFIDDQAKAIAIFRRLLDRDDMSDIEKGQVANNLAYLLAARGERLDEAAELADRALRLVGPNAGILDTRGLVHIMKGECDKAVQLLQESVSMDASIPGFPEYSQNSGEMQAQLYFHLALAHKCLDDRDAAKEAWEMAQARGFKASAMKPLKREKLDELLAWLTQ